MSVVLRLPWSLKSPLMALACLSLFMAGGAVTLGADVFRSFCVTLPFLASALLPLGQKAPQQKLCVPLLLAALGCVYLMSLLSLLWGKPGEQADFHLATRVCLLVSLGVLLIRPLYWKRFCRFLGWSLIAAALWAVSGALGWIQSEGFYFGFPLRLGFSNPNFLAVALVLACPLLLSGSFSSGRGRTVFRAAACVTLGMIALTGSRAGLISILAVLPVVAGIALVVLLKFRWQVLALSALMGAIAVGLAFALFSSSAQRTQVFNRISSSLEIDRGRQYIYDVAWQSVVDRPAGFLFGHGAKSLSRHADTVSPADFGHLGRRVKFANAHSEFIECLHDIGVAGLAVYAAILIFGWILLLRCVMNERLRYGRRLEALGLLGALLAWSLLCLFSEGTSSIAAQALFAAVMVRLTLLTGGPCVHVSLSPKRAFYARTALWASGAVAFLCVSAAFLSDAFVRRAFLHQHNPDSSIETSTRWAESALAFSWNSPIALYILLQNAIESRDSISVERWFKRLQSVSACYQDSVPIYALYLAEQKRFSEATFWMQRFEVVGPYDFRYTSYLPGLAYAAGDRQVLEEVLARLMRRATEGSNYLNGSQIRFQEVIIDNRELLVFSVEGKPNISIPRKDLPGIFLGRQPESLHEARELVRINVNRFFATEFGAGIPVLTRG